jgi:hypothetical protein
VVQVFVELRDGSVLDWNEFHRRYAEINNSVQLSHFIHVWAPTFAIENLSSLNRESYNFEVKMNDGWFLYWTSHSYPYDIPSLQCTKALILASDEEGQSFVIFLKQFEDGFERIWGGWIPYYNISLLRPDRKEVEYDDGPDTDETEIGMRYGGDWENSIVSTWETLRIG